MLTIGYKTETGYRSVPVYNVSAWIAAHPGWSLELRFSAPGANGYYIPAGVSVQDGVLMWTPDDTDTKITGTGNVQLWARDPSSEIRGAVTAHIYVQVLDSIHEAIEPQPPMLPYMERVLDAASNINIAVDAAQEAADSAKKSADSIKRLTAEATSVPYTAPVRAEYDPTTGVMHFDIPEGKPGSGGGGGDVPTHLSQLVDDLGSRPVHTHQQYLTQHQSLADYAKRSEIPAVPGWAMQAQKPSYTASEVHALPDNTFIPAKYNDTEVRRLIGENADDISRLKNDLTDLEQSIPTKLPNPNALTLTGAVSATYDGSAPVTVDIPQGGGGGAKEWRKIATLDLAQMLTDDAVKAEWTDLNGVTEIYFDWSLIKNGGTASSIQVQVNGVDIGTAIIPIGNSGTPYGWTRCTFDGRVWEIQKIAAPVGGATVQTMVTMQTVGRHIEGIGLCSTLTVKWYKQYAPSSGTLTIWVR